MAADRKNSTAPPDLRSCLDANDLTALMPPVPLTANATTPPTGDFFDATAAYVGAFKDSSDGWARGKWVVWSER